MCEISIKGSVDIVLELYPDLTFGAAMENSIAALERFNMPLALVWLTVAEKIFPKPPLIGS